MKKRNKKFKDCYGVIYLTTNIKNSKIYIGQTVYDNPDYLGSGVLILQAIKKNKKENFKKKILCVCYSRKELDFAEYYLIRIYQANKRNIGYNITKGGRDHDPFTFHPNKEKIREAMRQERKSRIFSERHRQNLSRRRMGIQYSDETKKAISESRKKLGLAKNAKNPTAKKYLLISPKDEIIFLHGKFVEFCKDNKLCYKLLKKVADNKRKEYKGWKCFHLNNYSLDFIINNIVDPYKKEILERIK